MLDRLPDDSPWRWASQEAIAEANRRMAATDADPAPGPTGEDIEAAASMSAGDRAAMIESMVGGLDAKLRQNPNDPEGWMKLVRSYAILGKADQARDALARGIKAMGNDTENGKRLVALAQSLGLSSTE
jgi:cytochrome c-type biogenesis protein CcmH